jgi:hypothetical protein
MAKTPKEYEKLPGRGMQVEGNRLVAVSRSLCSLWLGGDHLLLVQRMGFTETYKRFYYRDIQALMIRKTAGGAIMSTVLGVITAVLFLCGTVSNGSGRIALWIIGIIFALFTAISLWNGSSCVVQIKTSVQMERLPSWGRMRTARKGMERLRARLMEAQGAFFPEEIKAELEKRMGGSAQDWTS